MNYDVFLSHNSKDKPAVEHIGHLLTEKYRLRCWLDKWNLVPGEPWQEALETALDQCQTVATFVGPNAISPWANEEMRSALESRAGDRERRVIPVLLPGAPDSRDLQLPRFLTRLTWVDFRAGLDDEDALHRLYSGILGIAPGSVQKKKEEQKNSTAGSRRFARLQRSLWRKRNIWIPPVTIALLVLAVLWFTGNLYLDLPVFCGKSFSTAPGYIHVATEQRDNGMYACAIRNLQKALDVRPTPNERANIYYTLASVFIVKGQPVQALEYSRLGLETGVAYQHLLHVSKGIAHCQMQQNEEALQEFNIFLDLNPDPTNLLADNVKSTLTDLRQGKDLSDVCWVKLGTESLP
jgi:tetratricopeptide (TPR) repeat protein